MTNKTRALGFRLLGSLKNEAILLQSNNGSRHLWLINAKTGKSFAMIYLSDEYYVLSDDQGGMTHLPNFPQLVGAIKSLSAYPAPSERKAYIRKVTRHVTAVSGAVVA